MAMHRRTVAFTRASVPYPHTLLLSLTAEFPIYFFKVLSPNENLVLLFFPLQEDGRWQIKEKSSCPSRMCFQNCNLVKFFPLEYRSLSLITCCSPFTMITFPSSSSAMKGSFSNPHYENLVKFSERKFTQDRAPAKIASPNSIPQDWGLLEFLILTLNPSLKNFWSSQVSLLVAPDEF